MIGCMREEQVQGRRGAFYEATVPTVCEGCGEDFLQPADPGRPRRYCRRACQQKAYRRRHPEHASGTRYVTASSLQKRAEREAWVRVQAEAERERQRSERRRKAAKRPPRVPVPGWVYVGDTARAKKELRLVCRLAYERAAFSGESPEVCELLVARAEEIRARYGL